MIWSLGLSTNFYVFFGCWITSHIQIWGKYASPKCSSKSKLWNVPDTLIMQLTTLCPNEDVLIICTDQVTLQLSTGTFLRSKVKASMALYFKSNPVNVCIVHTACLFHSIHIMFIMSLHDAEQSDRLASLRKQGMRLLIAEHRGCLKHQCGSISVMWQWALIKQSLWFVMFFAGCVTYCVTETEIVLAKIYTVYLRCDIWF